MQKCIMIIAGEASGDLHGANLVRAIKRQASDIFCCGIGGDSMKAAGVRIIIEASTLSVVGITEVLSRLPEIFKGMNAIKTCLKVLRPDLLILIDFPDFNLRIARTAKKLGIPVLYYISPQIWAWRSGRVRNIAKLVDHMAVIFPFEEKFYQKYDVPVTFVGHPLLDKSEPERQPPIANRQQPTTIGLLPGSRTGEIEKHLPLMLQAAHILSRKYKNLKFEISLASSAKRMQIEKILQEYPGEASLRIISGGADNVLKQCSLAIAVSGTVTLETAIAGVPMIVIYKVSPITYLIGRLMIQVSHISLVNLIAGEGIVPELIQQNASPEHIAAEASKMLENPIKLEQLRQKLLRIRTRLGEPGASERVAEIALDMI